MNQTILDKENMDAARTLAKCNMQISEAQNILFKLQETETEYLEGREKKALAKIQQALDDSSELLQQIKQNNAEVHEFCNTVTSYAEFLSEAHAKFQAMLDAFNQRNELWDKNVKLQQKEFADIKRTIKRDQEDVDAQRKDIISKEKRLSEEKMLIESRQKALQDSYKVEKVLWEKLNSKKSYE